MISAKIAIGKFLDKNRFFNFLPYYMQNQFLQNFPGFRQLELDFSFNPRHFVIFN